MQDSAFIAALTSLSQGRGGDITINASDSIILAGDSQVQTSTFTAGESGDIFLNTKQLVMQDEALITSLTFAGSGRGGDITINASNAVILDGPEVGLTADSTPGGGDAGTISITTGQLLMQRNAVITATTLSASRGGDININATELVSLVGSSTDNLFPVIASQSNGTGKAGDITIRTGSLTLEAGALISAGTFSTGDAGNIFIDVEKLQVLSGSQIQASAALRSTGNAGSLAINASDSIIVSGVLESNPDEFASALLVQTGGSGAPGRLAISTKDLWVENGALISTSTLGNSDGGELIINADTIALQGTTPDGQFASGLGVITRGSGNGGNLRLTAKKLTIKDGAAIEASTFSSGDAGTITLQIADMLTITGTASGIYSDTNVDAVGQGGEIFISTGQLMMDNGAIISSSTFGSGTAGDIAINAEQVFLDSGAQIFASTFGAGNGGTITLQVVDSIILTGTSSSTPSGLFAIAATGSSGNAGSVVITTGNLTVQDGANISTRTDGSGNAGDLSITTNMLTAQRGATISTQTSSAGRAGDLTINTNQLLVDGAQISTSTSGSGAGGTFIINATDSITLTGTTDDFLSGLFTASEGGSGNAGNLFLTAGRLTLQDEAVISAATFGSGDAGDLTINVNQLLVEGGAKILSSTFSEGNGGTLTVTATDSITLTGVDDNGFVSGLFTAAEVGSSGNAGALFVTTGQLTVQDGAVISAATAGSGDAGDITINAKQIQLAGGGQIVSTTSGTGDGGTITVTAADSITLTGSDQNGEFPSGFFPATAATSSGNAGTLFVITEALTVSDGAEISSQALGSGNAGDLNITANALNLDNGSLVASAAEGGGGDIILDAEDIVLTNNSLISTNVFNSTGGGGEITINADLFIALENSDILATAVQGPGGNITITANTFLADVLANNGPTPSTEADFNTLRTNGRVDISATSQESVSGQISTPDVTFLESNLQELGVAFISSDQLVAGSCLNRQQVGPNPSSFSVSGTGGLPQTPYAAIQMNYAAAEIDATQNSSQSVQTGSNSSQESANTYTVKAWKLGDRIQEASGILITSDGRQLLSDRAQAHALKSSDALVCR
jgi:large exoprotein involved in heme utilization and adhesion